ncbi:MAG: AEC family transporter [Gemmatimonadota bacterium]
MSILLSTVAPVFGIMALGFVAARFRVLDQASVRGLVLFVFNFAIPILLFGGLTEIEIPEDVSWGFLVAFYVGSGAAYAMAMAIGRFFGRDLAAQAIFGMSGAFANLVLLGVPVILTAFGPEAALPMFLIIGFHSMTFMPITVALIHAGRGDGVSWRTQLLEVVAAVLKNPIVIGLLAGFAVNLSGLVLPSGIDRIVEMMGDAAIPTALFAMGASLVGYPARGDRAPAILLTVVKLLIHPFLVWLVAVPMLGLEGLWVSVAVVLAAMPTAVNTYLFGERYRAAPGVAARTVLLSSIFAVLTVSALLVILGA